MEATLAGVGVALFLAFAGGIWNLSSQIGGLKAEFKLFREDNSQRLDRQFNDLTERVVVAESKIERLRDRLFGGGVQL